MSAFDKNLNRKTSAEKTPVGTLGGPYRQESEEALDPENEIEYWRGAYPERPYYDPDYAFDAYEPAYRFGLASRARMNDRKWDDAEEDLRHDWSKNHDGGTLTWERAKEAIRDAWDHLTGDDSNETINRRR